MANNAVNNVRLISNIAISERKISRLPLKTRPIIPVKVKGQRKNIELLQAAKVTTRLAQLTCTAAELFFLPRSGRCCALLSPAAALLGQLMRG